MRLLPLLLALLAFQASAAERILCFGDSNTKGDTVKPEEKWPAVLQSLVPNTETINAGVNGRTVGQNNGRVNGLGSIDAALKDAGHLDDVILMLGTNDTRMIYWKPGGGAAGVAKRLQKLVNQIELYQPNGDAPPHLTIVVPPPASPRREGKPLDPADTSDSRNAHMEELLPLYREIALANGAKFVDLYSAMKADDLPKITRTDGSHFTPEGYARIAKLIAAAFEDHDKPAPPTHVKVADGKISWTASPDKNTLGYEIRDAEEDTTLTYSTTTEAKLPEGHSSAWVYTRDTYGNRSKAAKPGE